MGESDRAILHIHPRCSATTFERGVLSSQGGSMDGCPTWTTRYDAQRAKFEHDDHEASHGEEAEYDDEHV